MRVIFIVPCFNASRNLHALVSSLMSQNDNRWSCVIIDDISTDNTFEVANSIPSNKFATIKNNNKKYALRNIVETTRLYENRDDIVIAVIDGDDMLCNDNTVKLLLDEYENNNSDVVWTAHKWDINGMNISSEIPSNVDPYSWKWSSSHLRTFRSSLIKNISDINFKDCSGNWFKRGYDQALMLPILSLTKNRKFIPEVCYQYNINSVSIENRSWEEKDQISTINIVRSRGFLK